MKYCENCGAELKEGIKFCTRCGAKVMLPESAVPVQRPEHAAAPQRPEPAAAQPQISQPRRVPAEPQRMPEESRRVQAQPERRPHETRRVPAAAPQKPKKSGGVPVPVIAGAAGVLVLLLALAAGGFFFLRNHGSESAKSAGKAATAMEADANADAGEPEGQADKTEIAMTAPAEKKSGIAATTAYQAAETTGAMPPATTGAEPLPETNASIRPGQNSPVVKEPGWQQDPHGWKYYQENGEQIKGDWLEDDDGRWYYFDNDGYMLKNAVTPDGYRVGDDGAMIPETYQASAQNGSTAQAGNSAQASYSDAGAAGYNTGNISGSGEFVFPDSSSRLLSPSEVNGLNEWQCKVARNEIYARYGRRFRNEDLQRYFDGCSWYHGTIAPDAFNDDMLSKLEKDNVKTIEEYEKRMGFK